MTAAPQRKGSERTKHLLVIVRVVLVVEDDRNVFGVAVRQLIKDKEQIGTLSNRVNL